MGLQQRGRAVAQPLRSALSAGQLTELLDELRPAFCGRNLREVAPLPPRELLLVFEAEEEERGIHRLRVSAAPDGPRVHRQVGRVHRHKGPVGPFFETCRTELAGAQLHAIEQPRQDRLALLRFRRGDGERRVLIAELTGRHANVILCDGTERVLTLLVEPPAKSGREPRLKRGEPWVPPPGTPPAADPSEPGLAEFLAPRAGEQPAEDLPRAASEAPLSFLVEQVLGGAVEQTDRARAAKHLRDRLTTRAKKMRALQKGLGVKREAARGAERVLQDGELLKANIQELKRGLREVLLDDWYDPAGGKRRVTLDPKLSPKANVEKFFARYQKLLRSGGEVEREIQLASERLAQAEALLEQLQAEDSDPAALEARAVEAGLLEALARKRGARVQKVEPRKPYRSFVGANGGEILVGRNARDNDTLSLKIARGNDIWLHTADAPGSHVILRTNHGQPPHPEDLLDAAQLAIHFSPLKGTHKAGVHEVQAKYVKKPKGAPPGLVTLAGGRRREIRVESDRLARLLGEDRRPNAAER